MAIDLQPDNASPNITLYGIPNCTTVKKARQWLDERHIHYQFHDFKRQGVPAILTEWTNRFGWEAILNRRGTTWRKLPDTRKATISDAVSAILLMQEQPSSIKRPILVVAKTPHIGFDDNEWHTIFSRDTHD